MLSTKVYDEKFHIELQEISEEGIRLFGFRAMREKDVIFVSDALSKSEERVRALIDLIENHGVSDVHLQDVVDDFLYEEQKLHNL